MSQREGMILPTVIAVSLLALFSTLALGQVWQDYQVSSVYGGGSACKIELARVPGSTAFAILYSHSTPLYYMEGLDNTWTVEAIAPSVNTARRVGLAFHPVDATPYVSYQSGSGGEQLIAYRASVGWATEIVSASNAVGGSSLAFDPATLNPCLAYCTQSGDSIRYAWHSSGGWNTEVIKSGFGAYRDPSLQFDPVTGEPCMAYAQTFNGIYFARKSESIWSATQVVPFSFAEDPILRFSPLTGAAQISFNAGFGQGEDIRLAEWNGSSWDITSVSSGEVYFKYGFTHRSDGNPIIAHSGDLGSTTYTISLYEDDIWSTWGTLNSGQYNWSSACDVLFEGGEIYLGYEATNIGVHFAHSAMLSSVDGWEGY